MGFLRLGGMLSPPPDVTPKPKPAPPAKPPPTPPVPKEKRPTPSNFMASMVGGADDDDSPVPSRETERPPPEAPSEAVPPPSSAPAAPYRTPDAAAGEKSAVALEKALSEVQALQIAMAELRASNTELVRSERAAVEQSNSLAVRTQAIATAT